MNRRLIVGVVFAAAVIGGWALFRPELLFIDKTVDEALPGAIVTAPVAMVAAGSASPAMPMAAASPAMAEPIDQALLTGQFRGLAHETTGQAAVYQLADGKRLLRFTDFSTSNGPDVRVYLVAAADAPDNDTVTSAGFIDLGSIKGNRGDQNYELAADIDLSKYRAVSIWCKRFSVNFGAAPLAAAK